MRELQIDLIIDSVARLCQEVNFYLNDDLQECLKRAKRNEISQSGKNILGQLIENARIAAREKMPVCQDTGFTVVFAEVGNQLIINGDLKDAINKGVSKGYTEGYLRSSIVDDPLKRNNTGDNTPAVIYTEIVTGDKLKLTLAAKGGGSENMSRIKMLKPADGKQGVIDFVIETIKKAGPNTCPPVIVGIGIGGTFEKAALLSKKALLRKIDDNHSDRETADLEDELLKKINDLGIGPQGLGGNTTALAVKIEKYPCHIASLPVAVNLNCHASRHKEIIL